jgi:hypothetical protein
MPSKNALSIAKYFASPGFDLGALVWRPDAALVTPQRFGPPPGFPPRLDPRGMDLDPRPELLAG